MLSGIGPAEHLRAFGINVAADLPVGKNLQDHLGAYMTYTRKQPGTFHREMRFDRMAVSMIRAYLFGTGPGTVVPGGLHAFIKTRPELSVPDIEFMFRGTSARAASVVSAAAAGLPRRLRHPPDTAASRQPRRIAARARRSAQGAAHRLSLLHRAERPADLARRISSARAKWRFNKAHGSLSRRRESVRGCKSRPTTRSTPG